MATLETVLFESSGDRSVETSDYLTDQGLDESSGDFLGVYEAGKWLVTHADGSAAYSSALSDSNLTLDFYDRNELDEPDHILIVQPEGEQENVPFIGYLAPGDTLYVRKKTEVEYNENDSTFTLTRKGVTHTIETDFEDGGWDDIDIKYVGKNFDFNDIERPGFEPTSKQTLTILNVKAKDLWDDVTGPSQPCAKTIFKGTKENDILTGNDCNNVLIGKAGDDILNGGKGNDVLVGGKGRDTFVVSEGNDVIVNFNEEQDRIDFGDLQYGIDYIFDEFTNPLGNKGVNIVFAE